MINSSSRGWAMPETEFSVRSKIMLVRLVKIRKTAYRKAKKLYQQAFPPEEQAPFLMLLWKSRKSDVDFWSIYAGNQWAGLLYVVNDGNLSYIFYFAVCPEFRGRGVGSQALQEAQSIYQGRKFFLAAEAIDEHAPNYDERVRRKNFYLRNGFADLHRHVQEGTVIFELLGIGGDVTAEDYQHLMMNYIGKFIFRNITLRVLDD